MVRLFISVLLFFISCPAWATTWYVRDGGAAYGTSSTTCNGLYNVAYTTGNGPNCAVSTTFKIFGAGCDNYGTVGNCISAPIIASGDTVYIDGDSDTNPGQQAQFLMGNDGGNCVNYTNYCTMGNLPAGSDSSHRTTVKGTGTQYPQLWGSNAYEVFIAYNNHLDIENLEITDHSDCGNNFPSDGCSGSGVNEGLYTGGDDIILTNITIHGMARYGMKLYNSINVTFTNFKSIANGWGNETEDATNRGNSFTGTLTFNQPVIDWNGCEEKYPLVAPIGDPSNVKNCSGSANATADGIAIGTAID